jgi:hypothetical protein
VAKAALTGMTRIALRGVLTCALLLALGASASANTAGTRIYTVAGGGATLPGSGPFGAPLSTSLELQDPISLAPDGGDSFWVMEGGAADECVPLLASVPDGSDVGPMGYPVGIPGCNGNATIPPPLGSLGTYFQYNTQFGHPCCVSGWSGPLIANTDYSRIETVDNNRMNRVAGNNDSPAGCGTASPPPAPDNVSAANVDFCTISALETQGIGKSNFLIGETGRQQNGNGDLYQAVADPSDVLGNTFTIHHITGSYRIAGVAYGVYGTVLVADGDARVICVTCSGGAYVAAGTGVPAFSGDGGYGSDAELNKPTAVAVGYDQKLYIADSGNCRIRKLSDPPPAGAIITTYAGQDCVANGNVPADIGDGAPASSAFVGKPTDLAMVPGGLLILDKQTKRIRLIDRTSIVDAPAGTITDSTPSFTFASMDVPPFFKCTLDGGDPFDCPSPFTLPQTDDGHHTLAVWENGHPVDGEHDLYWSSPPDPSPAATSFTIDTTGPAGLSLQQPAAGATEGTASPTFTWAAATDALSAVDHYELWIDGAKNRDVPLSACLGSTCSAQAGAPLTEADHTWQVRAVDTHGNTSSTEARALSLSAPPVDAFTISPNPALAGRTVTFDASTSSDSSGIAHYEWDLDGDGSFETDGGGGATTSRTYAAPASVPIGLRVTDGSGKTATASQTLKVNAAPGAQDLLGISINSGAQYTKDPNVTLLVKPPGTATSILVSNDGGFLVPSTFPVSQSVKWKLDSSGPERLPKTVYARFMLGPIISETYTDDIILDEVPPVAQSASLSTTAPNGAATAARAKTYTLKVKAKDTNSGVGKLQVTANKKKPGKLITYRAKLKVKSPARPKFVRAQDRAGNFSGWKKLR